MDLEDLEVETLFVICDVGQHIFERAINLTPEIWQWVSESAKIHHKMKNYDKDSHLAIFASLHELFLKP